MPRHRVLLLVTLGFTSALSACSPSSATNASSTAATDGGVEGSTGCNPDLTTACEGAPFDQPCADNWNAIVDAGCQTTPDGSVWFTAGMAERCDGIYVLSADLVDTTFIEYFDSNTGALIGVFSGVAVNGDRACSGVIPTCNNPTPFVCPSDGGTKTVDSGPDGPDATPDTGSQDMTPDANACFAQQNETVCCCSGDELFQVSCAADGGFACPHGGLHFGADCSGNGCGGPCQLPCFDAGAGAHEDGGP